ncbi:glycosyltransferase [Mammaliicoccus vitulinus]|uniref:glycosyltransferase n=1 Tax=Mammaliicoccus TaxID=2803850 RepID=UPI0002F4F29B|nr:MULTISPECIES: glycosyltransferase [Mammaliicoccus]MBM6628711.1 glycosyltransferase [Mammaliicoccus vitulinus]MEB7656485.1 glycosyltransferase [Mammaliicoccus vitulinus]WQK87008.1 glycosyltransferase [Mammaliicoccus vitulinus]
MIHTITSTLPLVHGGRTKSLLYRLKFLEENLNEKSTIHVTNYNPHYLYVYEEFKQREIITEKLVIKNLYEWLSGNKLLEKIPTKTIFSKKVKTTSVKIPGLKEEIKDSIVRYYRDDEYVLYRKFYENTNVLRFEDYMSPLSKKRIERREYTKNGNLHRITNFSINNDVKLYEEFYDKNGSIYLKKYYADSKKTTLIYIILLKNNQPYKYFKSEKDMFTYYFNHVFEDGNIVFNDARLLDKPLIDCEKDLKRVLVFHSTHFTDDNIRNSYKLAFNSKEVIDKYIVLTDYQKNDILSEFEIEKEKFKVIPHFVETIRTNKNFGKENQFCYIGRISKEKQVNHIIRAFSIYIKKGYDTKLMIYGKDEQGEVDELKKLSSELGVEEYIEFKGYTDKPKEVFEKSIASILTSKFEGFGLTVMESINYGCPVISYNIKYGSSELIDNHQNGILVEKNNIDELAIAMENASNKQMKDVKLSDRFSLECAIKNYQELINELKT